MSAIAQPSFRLAPLPDPLQDRYRKPLPLLPPIKPGFSLPYFDEYGPGADSLLAISVTKASPSRRVETTFLASPSPSRKGKEKEIVVEIALNEQEDIDWAQVAEINSSWIRPIFEPLQSWNAPTSGTISDPTKLNSKSSYFAFDALTITSGSTIRLPSLHDQIASAPLPTKQLLDLLIRATTRKDATGKLKWDAKIAKFVWCGAPTEGFGNSTSPSVMEDLIYIGTAIKRIEILIDLESVKPLTPTHHAFFHAVSTYITYLKKRLADAIEQTVEMDAGRWHEAFPVLTDARTLSERFCEVMDWPQKDKRPTPLPQRASSLLSRLHSYLLAHLSPSTSTSPVCLALAYLLAQSSGPFLSQLHQWLGLDTSSPADDDLDPEAQPWHDLGITRQPRSPSEDGETRWAYEFTSNRMPDIIPKEHRRPLFEAGRSLRLLREASSGMHPICQGGWELKADWGWGKERVSSSDSTVRAHLRKVHREVEQWRRTTRQRFRSLSGSASTSKLRSARKERKRLAVDFLQTSASSSTTSALHQYARTGEQTPRSQPGTGELRSALDRTPGEYLKHSDPKTPLWGSTPSSTLETFHALHSDPSRALLPPDAPTLPIYVSFHVLAPPLAHAKLISTSLVSHYLDDLQLLDHLDILEAYFLGGDSAFAERVGSALFGKNETGSGETLAFGRRARARARMGMQDIADDPDQSANGERGISLSLSLSERGRWPPEGVELVYALRTTMLGDGLRHHGEVGQEASVWDDVEDRVSFAVKDMDNEAKDGSIARCTDPQAIESFDFLYLSYSPPSSIAQLLPGSLMAKYHLLQNYLLRLARVQTVLGFLYMEISHQASTSPSVFVRDRKLKLTLHRLLFRMTNVMSALQQYVVDTAIRINWSRMRRRLEKLKRREPGREESRPSTPMSAISQSQSQGDYLVAQTADERNEGDEEYADIQQIKQLHSIDSLVAYHHLTMDKILRSTLLSSSAEHVAAFDILTGLLRLVLNLGKLVKDIQRGVVEWEDASERVGGIAAAWEEREEIFVQALEKLSLKTGKEQPSRRTGSAGVAEEDLEMLIAGEEDEEGHEGVAGSADVRRGDLEELLLRLRLNGMGGGNIINYHDLQD